MKYHIHINKEDSKYLSKKDINNIIINQDNIEFDTNEKSFQLLNNEIKTLYIHNKRKDKIIKFIKKNIITILGILLMFIFLFNLSKTIQKIEFVDKDTYNDEVVDYLRSQMNKIGPFYYLNQSINQINFSLRNIFFNYEWISVEQKGTKLFVSIKKQDEKSFIDENSTVLGDIVAKKEGIVQLYFVKKGIVLIKEGQSVQSGDVLVSGNKKITTGGFDYIHPVGIVIADTIEFQNVKVKKELTSIIRTGKIETKDYFILFNKNKNDYSSFTSYEKEEKTIFQSKLFKKIKCTYYETKEIKTLYTLDEGIAYAKSLINKDFLLHKIHDKEELIDIKLIKTIEDNEFYHLKFVLKKKENIAIFQALKQENMNNQIIE